MEKQEYIQKNLDEAFRLWLGRAALWGCVVFLLLSLLDYVVTPQNAGTFLMYRGFISSFLLAGYFLSRTVAQKYLHALALAAIAGTAGTVELMILRFGGHASPYSVGIILLGISIMGFIPGRFRFHLTAAAVIYLIYLVPIMLTETIEKQVDFLVANCFMVMIFATMMIMRYLSGKSLVEELGLKYDLERYRERLEEEVADRTTELAGVVENLQKEIAERRKAEEERQRLQDQFLQAQKMESIGRLAGGVAHDFNNILTAILSYTELSLMKLPDGHPLRRHLNVIKEASEKAASLTHQLLAFSRKQLLEMRVVDLNVVVKDTVNILGRVIGEDVALELKLSNVKKVKADPTQIEQVLMNLAVNARDAMPAGGRLRVETADVALDEEFIKAHDLVKPGAYILLSVADTGAGMTKQVQARIFEPFFTTKERGKGTGLGLATVYGIVKQHNGHIFVDSEPGKGTTFRLYLPAAGELAAGAHEDGSGATPQGRETVLFVEGDLAVRTLIHEVLQGLGYRVLQASSGEEALAASDSCPGSIDLLLTDVVTAGVNGKQLADAMRSKHPGLAVLFMSACAGEALSFQELREANAALISKPLTPGMLALKVRETLDDQAGRRPHCREDNCSSDRLRAHPPEIS